MSVCHQVWGQAPDQRLPCGQPALDPDQAVELLAARDGTLYATRHLDMAHGLAGIEELFASRRRAAGSGPRPAGWTMWPNGAHLCQALSRHRSRSRGAAHDAARPGLRDPRCGRGDRAWRLPQPVLRPAAICRKYLLRLVLAGSRAGRKLLSAAPHARPQHAAAGCAGADGHHRAVTAGELARAGSCPGAGPLAQTYPVLTGREREVCARILTGQTERQIAAELGVGPGTVLTYCRHPIRSWG